MVFRRAGIHVAKSSLVFLSRDYVFAQPTDRLFKVMDKTRQASSRAKQFETMAGLQAARLYRNAPPPAHLNRSCRECEFFKTSCLGVGIPHTVLEIPLLHESKLNRLSEEGITDLRYLPEDLTLTDRQRRARDSILSGQLHWDSALCSALRTIRWPCHYLDFETVATVLPIYEGQGCHRQVLTQFSVHRRDNIDSQPRLTGRPVDWLAGAVYMPYTQAVQPNGQIPVAMNLLVKTAAGADQAAAEIRRIAIDANPDIPVGKVQTITQIVGTSISDFARRSGCFSALRPSRSFWPPSGSTVWCPTRLRSGLMRSVCGWRSAREPAAS